MGSPKMISPISACKFFLSTVPNKTYNRIAIVLGLILAFQLYSHYQRARPLPSPEPPKPNEPVLERANLPLWEEFQKGGGRLNDSSVPLTTRRLQLLTQADVAGANIDHNMSISNPCVTTSDLLKRAYLQPVPSPFAVFGQHKFIMRSAYRTSPNDFVAVGLQLLSTTKKRSDLEPRRAQKGECFWIGADGRKIEGEFRAVYPGEHHELMYETVVHTCQLRSPSTGRTGGSAIMILDGQSIVMYSETADAPDIYREPPFFLGFCSFPMYRGLNPHALDTWLQYHHHYVGVDFFVLQDGGSVDHDLLPVIEPYMNAGIMEVVDMRGEFKFETKHNVIALNDCLHRMAYTAKWVLFLDFDEFIYTVPPLSFKAVLQEGEVAPYFTLGSLWWSVDLCRNLGAPFLERMLFHWPHFYCIGENTHYAPEKCINYFGHRKFLVNPRKVQAVQVHRPIEPKEGGVDLAVTVAHINHFQGILRADKLLCAEPQEEGKTPEWWAEDKMIADIWKSVKHKKQPREAGK